MKVDKKERRQREQRMERDARGKFVKAKKKPPPLPPAVVNQLGRPVVPLTMRPYNVLEVLQPIQLFELV